MNNKFEDLSQFLAQKEKQGICLAFSGGIDSMLLLYLCRNLNAQAVTFKSIFQTEEEIDEAVNFAQKYGVKHGVIEFNPFENSSLRFNPENRCYLCKKMMFSQLKEYAKKEGLNYIADGTNFDDLKVFRPGLRAIEELGISSPFAQFEITKSEIREMAKISGIEDYLKPSNPCIATRFPYGEELSEDKIRKVKHGEKILKSFGFEENRLRFHKDIARIEIKPDKFQSFLEKREKIVKSLKSAGFKYITLDAEGLRRGSIDT